MTVTEQLPDDSVQAVEENVTIPVPETFDHVIAPVGKYPFIVAVHVTGTPTLSAVREHAITTVVAISRVFWSFSDTS